MSALRDYLAATGQSMTAFAERVGVSRPHLSQIADFRCKPSLDVAYAITMATGGVISMAYWIEASPHNTHTKEGEPK
jgi:DNA-binding transcriptional regulator YdaS (Cro superfamily)